MRLRPVAAARACRRAATVTTLTLAATAIAVAPASASVPEGWDTTESVSGLDFLLMLVILPGLLVLVIGVLAYLSASRPARYSSAVELLQQGQGQAWLGGPQKGVEAATGSSAEETGGASARW